MHRREPQLPGRVHVAVNEVEAERRTEEADGGLEIDIGQGRVNRHPRSPAVHAAEPLEEGQPIDVGVVLGDHSVKEGDEGRGLDGDPPTGGRKRNQGSPVVRACRCASSLWRLSQTITCRSCRNFLFGMALLDLGSLHRGSLHRGRLPVTHRGERGSASRWSAPFGPRLTVRAGRALAGSRTGRSRTRTGSGPRTGGSHLRLQRQATGSRCWG